MKSRIIRPLVFLILALTASVRLHAQIAATNPLEILALVEGNELIHHQMGKEMGNQTATAVLQNTIAGEFTKMKQWEAKYNGYLKTAEGYASTLKAYSHLYNEGVKVFITIGRIRNAAKDNKQGIFASMSMNNLYIETASELITAINLFNEAVAQGGEDNMLTGAERSQILWNLNDRLVSFSKKLNLLYMSIRYYTIEDVWNNAVAGIVEHSNGQVASRCLENWRRAASFAR